jgi:NTE family protein
VIRHLAIILLTLTVAAAAPARATPEAPGVTARIALKVAANQAAGRPTVAFVLNGGGARALATAGMLEVLEEAGVRPDFITGASMGSILGYLYASGLPAAELTRRVEAAALYAGISLALPGAGGTLDPRPAAALFTALGGSPAHRLETLPTPLVMVVTDLRSERPFYPVRGPALSWALVSAALPGALPPAVSGGLVLADGGILVNSPSDLARELGADVIIEFGRRPGTPEEAPPATFDDAGLRAALDTGRPATPVDPTSTGSVLAWSAYLNRARGSERAPGPDLIAIEAPVDTFPLLAFDHAAYFVEAGRREARLRLTEILALLDEARLHPGALPRPDPVQQLVEPLDVRLEERVEAYPIMELEFIGRRFDFRTGPGPLGGSRLGIGTTGPGLPGVAFELYATDAATPGFGLGARWSGIGLAVETGPALRVSAGPATLRTGPEGTAVGAAVGGIAGALEFLPAGVRGWATAGAELPLAGPLWLRGRVSGAAGPLRTIDPGGGNPARGVPVGLLAGSWALVADADMGIDLAVWTPPNTLLTGRLSLVPFAGLAAGEPGWAIGYGLAFESDLRVYGLLPVVFRFEVAGPDLQLALRLVLR